MRYWLCLGAAVLATACNPLSTSARTAPATDGVRDVSSTAELEALLRSDPVLAPLVDDAERRRLQVLVAVPQEDAGGSPSLRRLGFRVDAEYFYPASAVKLAVAAGALQKIDEANATPTTPLRIVEREGSRSRTLDTSVADEVERALVVSDNEANNRLFELVGRDELAERVAAMGLGATRIVHRLADPGERLSYSFELAAEGKEPVLVAQRIGYEAPALPAIGGMLVGSSYVDDGGRLVTAPMSFADKNRMSLRDLQDLLVAVVRPELAEGVDVRLAPRTREGLVATLGTLPSESRFKFPRALDDVHKPLASAVAAALPGDRVRVFGKGGRAYGFTIECSYVTNETTGRSVFVAAVVYANDNETMNDDRYQYEDVAEPFVAHLGHLVARTFLAEGSR